MSQPIPTISHGTRGPTLAYLENVDISEEKQEEGFYMPVQRVCRPDHTFRGFQGQIEGGERKGR